MFLNPPDYRKQIQRDNLLQIIGSNYYILDEAQAAAEEEAASFLIQKYDLSQEYQSTLPWDSSKTYAAEQRVSLDAPLFSPAAGYSTGAYVVHTVNGIQLLYKAKENITAGPFDAAKWDFIGEQYQLFYGKTPFPAFDLYQQYRIGDKVFFKGRVYTALQPSLFIGSSPSIQYVTYENVPVPNVSPDDPVSGAQYWGSGVPYFIPAGTDILNADYWVKGDNRSQLLVMYVIDMVLYHVHSRISPRNIPELRVSRYNAAISGLKGFAKGDTTPNIPVKQPTQGRRIRYGGNIKNQNSY